MLAHGMLLVARRVRYGEHGVVDDAVVADCV